MLQIWILLSMLPTRTGKNPTSLMPTFQFQAHFKVTKCSNCWRSYHSGCWPDKWIKPGDIRSRNLVLTCENCTSNGEIVYDENLQYIFNKDDNSGILHTLIIQPDYLLSILNIEKCELKYLASPAAITRNKNHIKVTRKGYIYFHISLKIPVLLNLAMQPKKDYLISYFTIIWYLEPPLTLTAYSKN